MIKQISCVYMIKNTKNGMVYIGQTIHFHRRVKEHLCSLRNNSAPNRLLQEHYNSMGESSFEFLILEEVKDTSQLLKLETKYINYFGGIECQGVYNCCDLSGHNISYRQHQSNAQKGVHTISVQGRQRISAANKGKTISEEQREKIRANAKMNPTYGMKGKFHTIESKYKMRVAKEGKYFGSDNPNYKYTPEIIDRLRCEYEECRNYAELSRRYNINSQTISRLIRLGHC